MNIEESEFIIIRHNGRIYKIHKISEETADKAYDRGWYIINTLESREDLSYIEKESLSHIWANEKYYGMKYN